MGYFGLNFGPLLVLPFFVTVGTVLAVYLCKRLLHWQKSDFLLFGIAYLVLLMFATNCYLLNSIGLMPFPREQTGQTTATETPGSEIASIQNIQGLIPAAPSKSAVNTCGSREVLSDEIWYRDFLGKAVMLERANPEDRKCTRQPGDIEIDCVSGKITEGNIGDVCYLADKNIVIALVPGEYLGPGFKLLQYDIRNGLLAVAQREDFHGGQGSAWFKFMDAKTPAEAKRDSYGWMAPPRVIEQAEEDTVIMTGRDGDAGCGVITTYRYNISDNYISVTKFCSGCVDYQTAEYEEICTELK